MSVSFLDNAAEILEHADASLTALMVEALRAKAYHDVAVIAAIAESVLTVHREQFEDRSQRRVTMAIPTDGGVPVEAKKGDQPSWMRSMP